jgi:hypothetical protein
VLIIYDTLYFIPTGRALFVVMLSKENIERMIVKEKVEKREN